MRSEVNVILVALFFLGGCATVREAPVEVLPAITPQSLPIPEVPKQGVYHKVKKGETLWRISRSYNINLDEIVASNNVPNAALIEEGQLVFIPGAEELKNVLVPQPEEKETQEFVWPVQGKVVGYFAEPKGLTTARGIRIRTNPGNDVVATKSGEVVFADYLSGYGYTIILKHADDFFTVYGNNVVLLAGLGENVGQRQVIARLNGQNSDTAVAYFEVRKQSRADNPLYYLSR